MFGTAVGAERDRHQAGDAGSHHSAKRQGDVGRPRHLQTSQLARRVTVRRELSTVSDRSKYSRFRLICRTEIGCEGCTY
jgi:hypothetical protein